MIGRMSRKPKAKLDDPAQSKRFIEMAREVEADKSPGAFERAFEKVVAKDNKAPSPKSRD